MYFLLGIRNGAADPVGLSGGDRLLPHNFLNEIDAVKFARRHKQLDHTHVVVLFAKSGNAAMKIVAVVT